jgi:hypothetical protein
MESASSLRGNDWHTCPDHRTEADAVPWTHQQVYQIESGNTWETVGHGRETVGHRRTHYSCTSEMNRSPL